MAIIDELERMQVFYVNIGGGRPTVPRLLGLVDYATATTSVGSPPTDCASPRRWPGVSPPATTSILQISLDGATAEVNDAVRGRGSFAMAIRALENLAAAGFADPKISVVVTRHNVGQLDDFQGPGAAIRGHLRITGCARRAAPTMGRPAPTREQQKGLYDWLVAHGERC